ncbi:MAG: hypothetical protein WDW38_010782 [Sanguina aurantia]
MQEASALSSHTHPAPLLRPIPGQAFAPEPQGSPTREDPGGSPTPVVDIPMYVAHISARETASVGPRRPVHTSTCDPQPCAPPGGPQGDPRCASGGFVDSRIRSTPAVASEGLGAAGTGTRGAAAGPSVAALQMSERLVTPRPVPEPNSPPPAETPHSTGGPSGRPGLHDSSAATQGPAGCAAAGSLDMTGVSQLQACGTRGGSSRSLLVALGVPIPMGHPLATDHTVLGRAGSLVAGGYPVGEGMLTSALRPDAADDDLSLPHDHTQQQQPRGRPPQQSRTPPAQRQQLLLPLQQQRQGRGSPPANPPPNAQLSET